MIGGDWGGASLTCAAVGEVSGGVEGADWRYRTGDEAPDEMTSTLRMLVA